MGKYTLSKLKDQLRCTLSGNWITGNYIDFSLIKLSSGKLSPLFKLNLTIGSEIIVTWEHKDNWLTSFTDDRLYFVVYNHTKKRYQLFDQATRQDEKMVLPFDGEVDDVLHAWAFCTSKDGSVASNSTYLGTLTN